MKCLIAFLPFFIIISAQQKTGAKPDDMIPETWFFGRSVQSTLNGRTNESFADYLSDDFTFKNCELTLTKEKTLELLHSYYPRGRMDFQVNCYGNFKGRTSWPNFCMDRNVGLVRWNEEIHHFQSPPPNKINIFVNAKYLIVNAFKTSDNGLIFTANLDGADIKLQVLIHAEPNKQLEGKYRILKAGSTEICNQE